MLGLAGNRLELSTAIFTDAVYADRLLSIDLILGTHAQDNVLRVARIFTAISKCMAGLRTHYNDLAATSVRVPGVDFPSPTADPFAAGLPKKMPKLRFLSKLDRVHGTRLLTVDADNERHATYLAEWPGGPAGDKTVVVKFTPKYNEDAHSLLANNTPPLAPALHSCTRVIGDLYMVVMEYLMDTDTDVKPLYDFFPQSSPHPHPPDTEVVQRDLTKALDLLHDKGLVFGDLRQANVLYSPKDGGRTYLVDFDGVGEDGKDRYSPGLNTKLGLGVERWQVMEKSHDRSNLDRIVQWHSMRVADSEGLKGWTDMDEGRQGRLIGPDSPLATCISNH